MLCGVNDMGRRLKLTPELIEQAAKLIAGGNYASTVFQMLGVGESTWYRWLEKGRDSKGRSIYREFWESIQKAEAAAEARAVSGVMAAGRRNWTAYAWYLERKFPDRWGRKDKVQQEISGPGGGAVRAEVEHSGAVDLFASIREYAKMYEQIAEEAAADGDADWDGAPEPMDTP